MIRDSTSDPRDPIIEYLYSQLIGPEGGEHEVMIADANPSTRYVMGVLYPQNTSNEENLLITDESDSSPTSTMEELIDDPVALSYQFLPSACGVSLFLEAGSDLAIVVHGAIYENHGSQGWFRVPLLDDSAPETIHFTAPLSGPWRREHRFVFGGLGRIDVIWRTTNQGLLVTVSLLNTKTADTNADTNRRRIIPSECLYQVSMRMSTQTGKILEYPSPASSSIDPEDEEMRLLYRKRRCFAIGHGCSANWEASNDGTARFVETDFLPSHTLPGSSVDGDGTHPDVLRLTWITDAKTSDDVLLAALGGFIGGYETWFMNIADVNNDITPHLFAARDRLLKRIEEATQSMRAGVTSLGSNPRALEAFRLANQAMLLQMERSRPDTDIHYWRPFQLAYQLMTLSSLIDEDSPDRESVDILWVPTGGGKTEAYLMLSAFEIFRRRLEYGDQGSGTTVITRYTLRLLTAQQFQRAATLICACEKIRRTAPSRFGSTPITIGLWVGAATSPNTYREANRLYREMLAQAEPQNYFQMNKCPWCAGLLIPLIQSDNYGEYGFRSYNDSFSVFCPSEECEFHDLLPVGVVDEQLYDQPPTILIATVDKFARLAWEERGGVFFGDDIHIPPTLIIQDELHLITGPLGTTVGLYESAISALLQLKRATPKVLASTATIRRPDLQVRGIFGKTIRLFPPSGLDADDSYFVKADNTTSRNRYVGVMSSSQSGITTFIRVSASLLQSRIEQEDLISSIDPDALDAYWSLVVYHNSLRELGNTSKYVRDDIPAWLRVIASTEDAARAIDEDAVLELTGTMNSEEIPESLARMSIPFHQPESVSVLLCTNMFSVGVDEQRLGLMLVNGQPKTTAEYIQATGRIGRGKTPGLVVTHYSGQKPRDRSHYESFNRYHSSLYSYVEPGSVTPFSLPSRERALHAALVILVRHWVGLSSNVSANQFKRDLPGVEEAIQTLLNIVRKVDPDELQATRRHIGLLLEHWESEAANSEHTGNRLVYSGRSRALNTLLTHFGSTSSGWPTLNSMRNVDRECVLEVGGNARA